ncbi:MAG: DNA repair protein RecO [Chloroflexi bacterium]|nr:DNA repair protein RecO [Chloroflexota bacterium]
MEEHLVAAPRLIRTEGVVLRRHDLGEVDRIVTLYTRHLGKVRAVAKGIRRPTSKLGGHLELFTHSQILLARGRHLDVITQAETISSFMGLRDDLWRASHAYYVAEVLDRLTVEREENQALFSLLVTTLERVAVARRPDQAVRLYEVQALDLLGYRPELRVCVQCREPLAPDRMTFSPTAGGVLCARCGDPRASEMLLTPNALKVLRLYQDGDWLTISRLRIDDALARQIEEVIAVYLRHVAENGFKSSEFVAVLRASPSVPNAAAGRPA